MVAVVDTFLLRGTITKMLVWSVEAFMVQTLASLTHCQCVTTMSRDHMAHVELKYQRHPVSFAFRALAML